MINENKPTSSISNETKTSFGETWDSILTMWATETRTWDEVSRLMDNESKVISSITNEPKI